MKKIFFLLVIILSGALSLVISLNILHLLNKDVKVFDQISPTSIFKEELKVSNYNDDSFIGAEVRVSTKNIKIVNFVLNPEITWDTQPFSCEGNLLFSESSICFSAVLLEGFSNDLSFGDIEYSILNSENYSITSEIIYSDGEKEVSEINSIVSFSAPNMSLEEIIKDNVLLTIFIAGANIIFIAIVFIVFRISISNKRIYIFPIVLFILLLVGCTYTYTEIIHKEDDILDTSVSNVPTLNFTVCTAEGNGCDIVGIDGLNQFINSLSGKTEHYAFNIKAGTYKTNNNVPLYGGSKNVALIRVHNLKVSLIGEGPTKSIFSGNGAAATTGIRVSGNANLTLSNLSIQDLKRTSNIDSCTSKCGNGSGIEMSETATLTTNNVHIKNGEYSALIMYTDTKVKLTNTELSGAKNHATIQSRHNSNLEIIDSKLFNAADSNEINATGNAKITIKGTNIYGTKKQSGISIGENVNITIANSKIYNTQGTGFITNDKVKATITNSEIYGTKSGSGIQLRGESEATISKNKIFSNSTNNIIIEAASKATITNNEIYDAKTNDGIRIVGSSNVIIKDNTIYSNKDNGIALKDTAESNITNNKISDNNNGISASNHSKVIISGNTIHGSKFYHGIYGEFDAVLTINNNQIYKNKDDGIKLITRAKSDISNNLVYLNKAGINLTQDTNATLTNNTFYLNAEPDLNLLEKSTATSKNNIIGRLNKDTNHSGTYTLTYNLIQTLSGKSAEGLGSNNVQNRDPLFVSAIDSDFRLRANSPALNAGDPSMKNKDNSRIHIGATGGQNSLLNSAPVTTVTTPIACGALDSNNDGKFSIVDLTSFVQRYTLAAPCSDDSETIGGTCGPRDFNKDKKLTILDLANFVSARYNQGRESCEI